MIEVVSYPADLSKWNPDEDPFYLELFGETRPLVNMSYAELLPADASDPSAHVAPSAPIYQYWWTIGHDGDPTRLAQTWHELRDDAAHVYMYFPLAYGWRIKELLATVQYLRPFHEHVTALEKTFDGLKNVVLPLAGGAGDIAKVIPPLAPAAPLLDAVSKLQFNAVPQTPGFEWAVSKVTAPIPGYGVTQGVMWRLPKRMFTDLGGRITGCLALTFIPATVQREGIGAGQAPAFKPGPILAHAGVFGPFDALLHKRQGPADVTMGGADRAPNDLMIEAHWEPPKGDFIKLWIEPRAPDVSGKPSSPTNTRPQGRAR